MRASDAGHLADADAARRFVLRYDDTVIDTCDGEDASIVSCRATHHPLSCAMSQNYQVLTTRMRWPSMCGIPQSASCPM